MTEAAFQAARKVMQKGNWIRGKITEAKGNVGKWTKIEASYRDQLKHGQADGAKKMLDKAMIKLDEWRRKFAELQFPDSNLTVSKIEKVQCEGCGNLIAKGNTYCGECLCEEDCDYL